MDAHLSPGFVELEEVVVVAGSRTPGRLVNAPAAVSVLTREEIQREGGDEQLPRLLLDEPGVELVQGDVQDWNLNARGLNSSLNRRLLVLHDGMDRSVGFLQSQEWWALGRPLDDFSRVEMVRGPGSALYGANAFSGVLNLTSAAPAEVAGTRIAIGGGLPGNGRFDVRHAGTAAEGRWGWKANLGYQSAWETFARSRTRSDARGACPPVARECSFEYGPLRVEDAAPDPGAVSVLYGSARADRAFANGSLLTVESGVARVRNQLLVVDVGRTQGDADRPWARVGYEGPEWNVIAWWDGRPHDRTRLLGGAVETAIDDQRLHLEAQGNRSLAADYSATKSAIVAGASVVRTAYTDIDGILRNAGGEGSAGELWSKSSGGPTRDGRRGIDLTAPGHNVFAAYGQSSYWRTLRFNLIQGGGGFYGRAGATSGSAPIVTGAVALMLQLRPTLTGAQAKQILQQTAVTDAQTGATPNEDWGWGKLDALAALDAVAALP